MSCQGPVERRWMTGDGRPLVDDGRRQWTMDDETMGDDGWMMDDLGCPVGERSQLRALDRAALCSRDLVGDAGPAPVCITVHNAALAALAWWHASRCRPRCQCAHRKLPAALQHRWSGNSQAIVSQNSILQSAIPYWESLSAHTLLQLLV